jgi:hypothetical protein
MATQPQPDAVAEVVGRAEHRARRDDDAFGKAGLEQRERVGAGGHFDPQDEAAGRVGDACACGEVPGNQVTRFVDAAGQRRAQAAAAARS